MSLSRPWYVVSSLCVVLLLGQPVLAQPAAYPAASLYTATACGSVASFDPLSDGGGAVGARDIVGDATHPALYTYSDGSYIYFRIRLEADPIVMAGGNSPLEQFGWGVGLDTDNDPSTIEYNIIANGITEVVSLVRVADGAVLQVFQPTLDTSTAPLFVPKYVEVLQATDGSLFGGDADYFLTVAAPLGDLAVATRSDLHPIRWGTFRVWAATSSNGTTLSGDFMCWNDSSGVVSLPNAISQEITLAASCNDRVMNGTETDIDCGGSCAACALDKSCGTNTDCLSASCSGGKLCVSPCPLAADGTDCDTDGLSNLVEDKNGNGIVDLGETDLNDADSDDDGVSDGAEDANHNGVFDTGETDPLDGDTDGDELSDGREDADKDGVWDEGTETDPRKADTDGDALGDGAEDGDHDGAVDTGETDPRLADTDGGGEEDGHELLVTHHDPLNPADDDDLLVDAGVDSGAHHELGVQPDGAPADLTSHADGTTVADSTVADSTAADSTAADSTAADLAPRTDGAGADLKTRVDSGLSLDRGVDARARQDARADALSGDTRPDLQGEGAHADSERAQEDLYLYGGGCGCSFGARSVDCGWAALLVLAGLVLALRRRRGRWLLIFALLVLNPPAKAETLQFPLVNFQLAPSTINFFVTQDAHTLPSLVPSAGLYFSYAHEPLELWSKSDDRTVSEVIRYQVNMDLLLALGIGSRFELGLALPVTLAQESQENAVQLGMLASPAGPGIGDLRVVPKFRLFERGPVALALAAPVAFPTGSEEDFLGSSGVTFAPTVIATLSTRVIDVGLNAGYRVRSAQSVQVSAAQQQVTINDDLLLSLGVRIPLVRGRLDLMGDAFMAMAIDEQDQEEIPVELLGGLRYHLPKGFVANIGAGPGLTRGVGAPAFRVLAGVGYQYQPPPAPVAPPPPADKDGDGILDAADKCPNEAEDQDSFEDEDGCPELDNDRDGLADAKDKCPNVAEDKDGFEDEDGCPDLDNDRDGIPDLKDKCPLEPETFNSVDDEDGCPDQAKGPVQIEHGKITVPPVFFATNRDVILKQSERTLQEVAETLRRNPWIKRVRIEGHTDNQGKGEYNLELSRRRAASVLRFLTGRMIEEGRLESQGFGAAQPITSNATNVGRGKNRRVEFVIVDPPLPAPQAPASTPAPQAPPPTPAPAAQPPQP